MKCCIHLIAWIVFNSVTKLVLTQHVPNEQYVLRPETSKDELQGQFLHITDIHMDKHYKEDATYKSSCHRLPKKHKKRKKKNGQLAGFWGSPMTDCDSPEHLVYSMIRSIGKEWRDRLDFVIWTGDNARHDSDSKIKRTGHEILEYSRKVTSALQDAFRRHDNATIPIVPSIGNNDVHPHNVFNGSQVLAINPQLEAFLQMWQDMIPIDQHDTFRTGGYYAIDVTPGVRVLSLNTMYFFKSNDVIPGCHQEGPGKAHMEWLRGKLERARDDGVRVYMTGHVPPSVKSYKRTCLRDYIDVSIAYSPIIAGHMYGHANMDHFQIFGKDLTISSEEMGTTRNTDQFTTQLKKQYKKAQKFNDDDLIVVHVAPSLLPVYYPSFRINQYDVSMSEHHGTWLQYTQWYANLTYWNNDRHPPKFMLEYGTDSAYDMKELSSKNWVELAGRMVSASESAKILWNTYLDNMFLQTSPDMGD